MVTLHPGRVNPGSLWAGAQPSQEASRQHSLSAGTIHARTSREPSPGSRVCAGFSPRTASVLREGIAAVLGSETGVVVIAEATNGAEAIEQFRAHRPDVTLMDLQMLLMDGTDAILAIRQLFPEARIIVLTTYSGDAQVTRALKAGASGYWLNSMLRKELVETIRTVPAGHKRIPPRSPHRWPSTTATMG
jgi:CheY-like chemotaxis protein